MATIMDKKWKTKLLLGGAVAALGFLVGVSVAVGVSEKKKGTAASAASATGRQSKRVAAAATGNEEVFLVTGVSEDREKPRYDWIQGDAEGVAAAYGGVVASSKLLEEVLLTRKASTWPRHGWALDVRDGQLHAFSLNQLKPPDGFGPKVVDFGSEPRRSGVWVWGMRPSVPIPGHLIVSV